MTVLYYLNGVSGTWFPLASGMSLSLQDPPRTEGDALERVRVQGLIPGTDGILAGSMDNANNGGANVPIQPGDALVFYSYKKDPLVPACPIQQDWQALHAGLPAPEQKWIATHWFHMKSS